MIKRFLLGILSIVIILCCSLVRYNYKVGVPAQADISDKKIIIIDAGHGGLTNTID